MLQLSSALKALGFVMAGILLTACATSSSVPDVVLPDNAVAKSRDELRRDMLRAVDQYISKKFACDNWSVEEITDSKASGQLVFTSSGQLYQGSATETWQIRQCDSQISLNLGVESSANGGSIIKIRGN